MLEYVQFNPSFHVEILSDHQVIVIDAQGEKTLLKGEIYVFIAQGLLSSKNSIEQLFTTCKHRFSRECFYYAIFRLHSKGVIEQLEPNLPKPLAAFSGLLGVPSCEASKALTQKAITAYFLKKEDSKEFKKQCSRMSIRLLQKGDLNVVLTDNYRNEKLRGFHERFVKQKKPWLLVQPEGGEIQIGPLFIPGETACFQCLKLALEYSQAEHIHLEEKRKSQISYPIADLPISKSVGINLAIGEIFKWIVKGTNPAIEGKILSLNLCSMELRSHTVLQREDCKFCTSQLKPSIYKNFSGLKDLSENYCHLISPITGIARNMTSVSSVSPILHNFFAVTHLASVEFMRTSIAGYQRTTAVGGKGISEIEAKAVCLCEAIERYSGVYQGYETRKRARYLELGEKAIHPASVLLFSDHQYEIREQWNKNRHKFHFIPSPFDETQLIDWSPLWSLTENDWKWLPTAFCYYGYPRETGIFEFCRADSNGCAAGNTKTEAIISGFLELVERDSVALWWYSRLKRPEIEMDSFQHPYISQLKGYYAGVGRKIWAIDLTIDLEVSVFAAISSNASGEEIIFGFGANVNPTSALLSALLEMNQGYNIFKWKEGKMMDPPRNEWIRFATLENQPYLLPDPNLPKKQLKDYAYWDFLKNGDEELSICQSIAVRHEFEVLVLDQTRSHIGMPVVRVVVPGLRHFWNRHGPGRLYDVPQQMGLVKRKLDESELNPIPMFL